MCGPVLRRHADPRIRQVRHVGLRLLDLVGEQRLVDGTVIHVSKRHTSAGQHAAELDDPADQIRVGLLPKGFFALAEELIQEGRDRVRERVRIEPGGTQGIPRQPTIETQLDVVLASVQLGQHPTDVVAKIALHFQDQRRRAPLGIRRLPAEELARERVHTRRRLAGPDRAENRHARIEAPLRDRQPFGGRALDGSDRVMDLADDDGRPVGRRRKRPARKAGPEPYTDAHPGEPDPGCAVEQVPGEEHGHAGRDVVPRDDGAVHVRGVVADEHRHGIGLGKHAGPRPGARDTDAADDQERADASVRHRAARLGSSSGPRAGRGAFLQGYIQTGATSPKARGGMGHPPLLFLGHPPAVRVPFSLPRSLPRNGARCGGTIREQPRGWSAGRWARS